MTAWEDLKDRLRWRTYFAEQQIFSPEDLTPWDPDYATTKVRKTFEPEPNQLLEWAFQEGDKYVASVTTSCPPDMGKSATPPLTIAALQKWVSVNNYVVLPTDKNLGCCVVTSKFTHYFFTTFGTFFK